MAANAFCLSLSLRSCSFRVSRSRRSSSFRASRSLRSSSRSCLCSLSRRCFSARCNSPRASRAARSLVRMTASTICLSLATSMPCFWAMSGRYNIHSTIGSFASRSTSIRRRRAFSSASGKATILSFGDVLLGSFTVRSRLLRADEQEPGYADDTAAGLAISGGPPQFTGRQHLICPEVLAEGRTVVSDCATKISVRRANSLFAPLTQRAHGLADLGGGLLLGQPLVSNAAHYISPTFRREMHHSGDGEKSAVKERFLGP